MGWKNLFRKDWVLKLISLAFAIILWFFIIGEEKSELTISLPLELVNLPPQYMITNEIPASVDIRVYGPRTMVHAMASQRLNKVIDLKNAHQGVTTVNITPDSIPTPNGVRVTMIQPSKIDITIEKIVNHIVKVKPIIQGKVADGYEIKKTDVVPAIIAVFGPASEIKKIKDVRTDTINIEGKSKTFNTVSGFSINNSKITSFEPEKVTVFVKIEPIMDQASFKKVPISGLKENMVTSTKAVTVTVKGPVLQLKNMQPEQISVKIPDKNFEPGSHSVSPEIVLPEGIELIKITPQEIKITLPNMKGEGANR